MTTKHTIREGWLVAAIHALDDEFFAGRGHKIPIKIQVACGWPKASRKATGQCWSPSASADKTTQMYVSPTQDSPVKVLDILLHEMIHAAVGCEHGHKGPFRTVAKSFGLMGKMTETYAEEGSDLEALLIGISDQLGPYPHAAMTKTDSKARVYPYKWSRLMSINDRSYTVTISPRLMETHGRPVDPWGDEMVNFVK